MAQIDDLVILPVAIAPQQERVQGTFPEKAAYNGQNRIPLANSIADYCRQEIITLLK